MQERSSADRSPADAWIVLARARTASAETLAFVREVADAIARVGWWENLSTVL
jgi:hypothetical protein